MILALHSSYKSGSLCLYKDGDFFESSWPQKLSHSEQIVPQIESLLAKAGTTLNELSDLICTYGPGSFTGIRVGLSVVKAIGYSTGARIWKVDDCIALALNSLVSDGTIQIALNAQKNKVFYGEYSKLKGVVTEVLSPCLQDFASLDRKEEGLLFGDGWAIGENPNFSHADLGLQVCTKSLIESYMNPSVTCFTQTDWKHLTAKYLRVSAAEEVRKKTNTPR